MTINRSGRVFGALWMGHVSRIERIRRGEIERKSRARHVSVAGRKGDTGHRRTLLNVIAARTLVLSFKGATKTSLPQNSFNLGAERGPNFDLRHRFAYNFVYDLPAFAERGAAFASSSAAYNSPARPPANRSALHRQQQIRRERFRRSIMRLRMR